MSKKPPHSLTRRSAPRAKNTPQTRQVLFGLHYTTKFEPSSSRRATDVARAARVVAWYFFVRSDSVVTRTPPRAEYRASALAPFPFSMLFLFRGGILFEIEWAETGLGRALPLRARRAALNAECKYSMVPRVYFLASGSSGHGVSPSASASGISAMATSA